VIINKASSTDCVLNSTSLILSLQQNSTWRLKLIYTIFKTFDVLNGDRTPKETFNPEAIFLTVLT